MTRNPEELFAIGVVADLLGVTAQTLRLYEAKGLIDPPRTAGGTRLYRRSDVDRLRRILFLAQDQGVNLAGVKIILDMEDRFRELEERRRRQFESFLAQIEDEFFRRLRPAKDALVHVGRGFLVRFANSRHGGRGNPDLP